MLEHRASAGEDIDVGLTGKTQAELKCLYDAYVVAEYDVSISGEKLVLDPVTGNAVRDTPSTNHIHMWDGTTRFY